MSCRALAATVALLAPVASVRAEAPGAFVSPTSLSLGTGTTATVTVRSSGEGRLRASANVGSLKSSDDPYAQEQRFVYTPPDTRYPQTALLLFWREEEEAPEATVVRLPLWGRTDLMVQTEPGAIVHIELGPARFGPVPSDPAGHATLTVEVPPGVNEARVLGEARGQRSERTVTIGAPPPSPMVAALSPETMHPRYGGWLMVAATEPLDPEQLRLSLEGGRAEPIGATGEVARFRVYSSGATDVLRAHIERGDSRVTTQASLSLDAPVPLAYQGRLSGELSAGGHFAGGGGLGVSARLAVGYRFSTLQERLTAELGVGFEGAGVSTSTLVGSLRSSISSFPLEASVRARLLRRGSWAFYLRTGAGVVPFTHVTQSDFQPTFSERGLGYVVFAAAQLGRRAGPLELFGELRGAFGLLQTPRFATDGGGFFIGLGGRYAFFGSVQPKNALP
ncbi:MAG: hypothetical protein ACOZIN_20925 [Myxococcota bacterium]